MAKPFRLGFIGIGIMGAPMVRRLRERGWEVTVWNRESERFSEVEGSGAKWAASPAAVRAASDVVLICVLGEDAIESVCLGGEGLISGSGASAVIDLSTTSPQMTASLVQRTKLDWLDCPVSGGPGAAGQGTLTVMAGGDRSVFERYRPILDDLAANLTLMGPSGSGQVTKVVNQAIVGASYIVVAEALAMIRSAGLDALTVAAALKGGAADSTILQTIFKQMANDDFEPPRSRAKQLAKDMHSVAAFSGGHGLALPVVEAAVRQFDAYLEQGGGEADSASISRLYTK